jgi:hypothetical protein
MAACCAGKAMLTVLSLCDYTGNWSKPYRDAGYDVRQIDLQHGDDVRLFEALPYPVRGILAAPPCTEFARSGAQWWQGKGQKPLLEGLALVDACCRIILMHRPQWWVIENPIGRLKQWLGEPSYIFNPADYGEPYTKRTCLWGRFNAPYKTPVEATEGSKTHVFPDSKNRGTLRSATPVGFAKAFFEANP